MTTSQLCLMATTAALGCLLGVACYGQSTFTLDNRVSRLVDAPVFSAEGIPLEGTNYLAELWGGPAPDDLKPIIDAQTNVRVIGNFGRGGGYISVPRTAGPLIVPTVPAGDWAWLQLRAWDGRLGATYEAAVARGIGGVGDSPLFTGRGPRPWDYTLPGLLIGLRSFSLRPGTGVLVHGIRIEAGQVVVEWFGGFKQYRLQARAALDVPWQDLGAPTTNLTATVAPTDGARFFRVIGLLE
jgi:hypothetical protein